MVEHGYSELDVMEMALDKLDLCTKSIHRRMSDNRAIMVMDTAGAVAGILGEKGNLTKYLENLKD
ncbi:MAG: hypothetical protein BMS9Abin11_1018 [Gammaproteobacteria bacterium]|nr:MAG: hypothetical protein BMS9Abin11_1018 [Gammaproteobacteria bacterium]